MSFLRYFLLKLKELSPGAILFFIIGFISEGHYKSVYSAVSFTFILFFAFAVTVLIGALMNFERDTR